MNKGSLSRPLGAYEKAFWLLDFVNHLNFAMAMEIEGTPSENEWKAALASIQSRHSNLSVSIHVGEDGRPEFRHISNDNIPLRVIVADENFQWESEIEMELSLPLDSTKAPLARAILVQKHDSSVFILTAHHSIADGKSYSYIMRDLLSEITGEKLQILPFMGSVDDILGLPEAKGNGPGFENVLPVIAHKGSPNLNISTRGLPHLERIQFSSLLTQKILNRSRMEKTTFHGALCAAALGACRELSPALNDKIIQLLTPIDCRNALGANDECWLCISSKSISFEPHADWSFWELARFAKGALAGTKSIEYVQGFMDYIRQAVFSNLSYQSMFDILASILIQDIMVTNLGLIDVKTDYDTLKLKSLWGPIVNSGNDYAQNIGACTINGSLHLTHYSWSPIEFLLKKMKQIMETACESEILQS